MAHFSRVAAQVLLIMNASPALADEGASGLYAPGNFGFGAGVTPDAGLYLSTGFARYEGDIRIFIDGGRIIADAEARPYSLAFAALWVPQIEVLGGNLGLSIGSAEKFAWAHGEVRGLINFEVTRAKVALSGLSVMWCIRRCCSSGLCASLFASCKSSTR